MKHRDFNKAYDRLSQKGKNAFEMLLSGIELTDGFFKPGADNRVIVIDDHPGQLLADGKREAV